MSQPLPLVEQLKNLEQLQEIDLKIDSLKKNQSSLPASLKAIDESLGKLKGTALVKNTQISEMEKVNRQTQAALELNQDRLTRANQKLESVHNSVEFQAATKEIEQLKKLNASLEEQHKKTSADIEAARTDAKGLADQVAVMQQKKRDAEAATLSGQDQQFKSDIGTLTAEKLKYSSNVEPKILGQYDRVRMARNGLGIVPAVGGRCKGCNMMVPPQLFNEVQRGTSLHSCPCCHRLLFVPIQAAAVEDADK